MIRIERDYFGIDEGIFYDFSLLPNVLELLPCKIEGKRVSDYKVEVITGTDFSDKKNATVFISKSKISRVGLCFRLFGRGIGWWYNTKRYRKTLIPGEIPMFKKMYKHEI